MPKLFWKVAAHPSGPYASFERRGWPTAYYSNGDPAAILMCEEDYIPANVKKGNHAPISIAVADWSNRDRNGADAAAFVYKKLKQQFHLIEDAKAAAERALDQHIQFQPKGEVK